MWEHASGARRHGRHFVGTRREERKRKKKEKKEKKKKKKDTNDHDEKACEKKLVVNGETAANNVDDLDFWLSPSKKPEVKSTTAPNKEEIKPKKSKKKKKSKEADSCHQIIQTNGIGKKHALKFLEKCNFYL